MTGLDVSGVQTGKPEPLQGTRINFPSGATTGVANLVSLLPGADGRLVLITDETPFHPVDPFWPDQPGDLGHLCLDREGRIPVVGSVTVARLANGTVLIDRDIDIARNAPDVTWLVGHQIDRLDVQSRVGSQVELHVDSGRRQALSAAHTTCHLVALALNQAVAELWRKAVPLDSRGNPNLDGAACVHSHHELDGSVDRYRLGKSLRRRGFSVEQLLSDLDRYSDVITTTVNSWLSPRVDVRVEVDGPFLSDRRTWVCNLPDGLARMPCGGTHVQHLGQVASVSVAATVNADRDELTLRTTTAASGT